MGINISKVKAFRALNGETQEDVSKVLGISKVSYNKKESGKCDFKSEEIGKLSNHWKVSVNSLFDVENI